MITILLISVGIVIYYIMRYDHFGQMKYLLLILMVNMPVMASPIDDRDKFYDELYENLWEAQREERMKNRTLPEDSINKALMEFQYGSYGSTKSQELLQLPSDEDQQGS